MRRVLAAVTLASFGSTVWLGCDQIFGLSDASTIPYPDEGGADGGGMDGTIGSDSSTDSPASDSTTSGGDASDGASVGDGAGPSDSAVETGPTCNPALAWAKMFDAALVPPFLLGGLDLRGADDAGITLQQVQQIACLTVDGGPSALPGDWTAYWGGDGGSAVESLSYDPISGRYQAIEMYPGYTGAMDFHGADGGAYHMALTGEITKNDASFPLDWADAIVDASTIQSQVTELRNAMVATFAPGTPPSANCAVDQTCVVTYYGSGTGFIGIRAPLFFYADFNDTLAHPSTPADFYAYTNFLQFNDPTQSDRWQSFDTKSLGASVQSFAGVALQNGTALFLVPNGSSPVARFAITSDAFSSADGGAWSTFDPSVLTPPPSGFAGGEYDGQFVIMAGTSGVCAEYDTSAGFTNPNGWYSFDTKTLPAPAGSSFAGAVALTYGAALLVPSNSGVVVSYTENALPSDFTSAVNWTSFNLATLDPGVNGFYGGVTQQYNSGSPTPVYLVPNKGTVAAAYVGWPAAVNTASSWSFFDLATVPSSLNAVGPAYATGVHDEAEFVYLSPAVAGYPAVRYDTKKAFTDSTAWEAGRQAIDINVKATGFDGRFVYFAGDTTKVWRYDSTLDFAQSTSAWTSFDVSAFDNSAVGFGGTANDQRYQYFIPQSSSVAMRFDSRFGPGLPRVTFSSF